MTGYEYLANAIVKEAAIDYREAREKQAEGNTDQNWKWIIRSIERFFKSGWCALLSRDTGNYIIAQLKRECDEKYADTKGVLK